MDRLINFMSNTRIDTTAIIILIVSSLIVTIYRRLSMKHNYWSNRGIDGPKPVPILGNWLDANTAPFHVLDMERKKIYGDIYGTFEGYSPILTISDPELLKKILVKDFHVFTDRYPGSAPHKLLEKTMFFLQGKKWKRVRSLVTPTFTSSKLRSGLHLTSNCAARVIENLEVAAKSGEDVNLKTTFAAYTLDVIARAAFGTDIDTHKDPDNLFVENLNKFFTISYWRTLILLLFPRAAQLFGITFTHPSSLQFFESVCMKIIQERKKSNESFDDLLQHLMDAEEDGDEEADNADVNTDKLIARNSCSSSEESFAVDEDSSSSKKKKMIIDTENKRTLPARRRSAVPLTADKTSSAVLDLDKRLSQDEIIAQSFIFLIAGYETTASLLTHTIYSLAINVDIQEKLFDEINKSITESRTRLSGGGGDGDMDKIIDYDFLQNIPYLDAVLNETLRLYSPLYRLDRTANADYVDNLTGLRIEKGTRISIPIHVVHRDGHHYVNPDQFDPQRFINSNEKNSSLSCKSRINPYTFLPFGTGPRNCVGMRFALLEAKLCMVNMMIKYRFYRVDKTDVPLEIPKFQAVFQAARVIVGVAKR